MHERWVAANMKIKSMESKFKTMNAFQVQYDRDHGGVVLGSAGKGEIAETDKNFEYMRDTMISFRKQIESQAFRTQVFAISLSPCAVCIFCLIFFARVIIYVDNLLMLFKNFIPLHLLFYS